MYRQGDVLIIPIKRLPPSLEPVMREDGRVILAHGEATGHAHAIASERAAIFRDLKLAAVFMHVTDEVDLVHNEHDTITIPAGSYRVVRQREYGPEAVRNVAD